MSNLDELAEKIKASRPERGITLVLVNEATKEYAVIALPVGWRASDEKPFDLNQKGYQFVSKYQAGICSGEGS